MSTFYKIIRHCIYSVNTAFNTSFMRLKLCRMFAAIHILYTFRTILLGFIGFGHSSFSPGKSPLSRDPRIRLQAESPRTHTHTKKKKKNTAAPDGAAVFLVREAGLEPARPE